MFVIAYLTFIILLVVSLLVGFQFWRSLASINNPVFLQFQRKYFKVYLLALIAEWLQGPYTYKLYADYGFVDPYIGIIYVSGYAASILFGAATISIAERCGRKKVCIIFALLYSLGCATKLSRDFYILCTGRVISGVATSLLFHTFDSWYVYEHTEGHQFPEEWLDSTLSKVSLMNSAVAVSAGFIANMLSEWLSLGSASPFIFAIPFLLAASYIIHRTWTENHGKSSSSSCTPCLEGLRSIVADKNIMLVGWAQSMFESVMYVFVFLWTPVLQPSAPPLGIVFSAFMCATWIGGSCYQLVIKNRVKDTVTITMVIYAAMFANVAAALASANHPRSSFLIFLLIEFLCGVYFPAMGRLRSNILPKAQHSSIMNWFRIPLNAVASFALLDLHDSHSSHGITHMFTLCAALLLCGGCSALLLHQRVCKQEPSIQQEPFVEIASPVPMMLVDNVTDDAADTRTVLAPTL